MKQTNDIAEFCDKHGACADGREWALANCKNMAEAWDKAKPEWLVWIATREGVLDDRTLRLFACWCVRQVWGKLTDERSKNAVVVAERYAEGKATREELAAARDAASAAAWDAESAAAWASAWVAARAAASAAASAAAWAAERVAAWDVARDAAWVATSVHLREIGNPFKARVARRVTRRRDGTHKRGAGK